MAELARGSTVDRPWGRTLGALGLRGVTGQVTLAADGKRFAVAFVQGAVAGAVSPLANDAAVRVAMTAGLISSTQVADIARRQVAAPERDEVDVIVEAARLSPDLALRLRRRVVAQRAARTFSPERGDFVVQDQIAMPIAAGAELDVRAVIYLGARSNLSDARLEGELAQMGAWFTLKAAAVADLVQFGFGDAERPLIELLQIGASVGDLLQANHGLDVRGVRAVLYALAACNALDFDPSSWSSGVAAARGQPAWGAPPPPVAQPPLPQQPPWGAPRAATPPPRAATPPPAAPPRAAPPPPRAATPPPRAPTAQPAPAPPQPQQRARPRRLVRPPSRRRVPSAAASA